MALRIGGTERFDLVALAQLRPGDVIELADETHIYLHDGEVIAQTAGSRVAKIWGREYAYGIGWTAPAFYDVSEAFRLVERDN